MRVVINGEDFGVACPAIPTGVRAVFSLAGHTTGISITSSHKGANTPQEESQASHMQDSLENILEKEGGGVENTSQLEFHDNRGRNVTLCHSNTLAKRNESYNQGIVMSGRPLQRNTLFQIVISHLTPRWSSSLTVGITCLSPDKIHLPVSLLHLKKESWVICGDGVYQNGTKVKTRYGPNLDSLTVGHSVGLLIDTENRLHLYVNNVDQGVACQDIPHKVFAVFDLYGKCDEIVIGNGDNEQLQECIRKDPGSKEEKDSKNCMSSSQKLEILPHQFSRNCEYLSLCTKFKVSMGLPNFFFDTSVAICYCETCHKLRSEEVIQSQGDPKKKYALPIGWVKFPLKVQQKEGNEDRDLWHIAYHGTNPGWIRRMMDTGKLLTQGEVGLERRKGPQAKSKEDDMDTPLIFFSPTINYAGLEKFSPGKKFQNRQTGTAHIARVALMVSVEPGSYKVGETQGLEGVNRWEAGLDPEEREWVSKERGNTSMAALLVKIE